MCKASWVHHLLEQGKANKQIIKWGKKFDWMITKGDYHSASELEEGVSWIHPLDPKSRVQKWAYLNFGASYPAKKDISLRNPIWEKGKMKNEKWKIVCIESPSSVNCRDNPPLSNIWISAWPITYKFVTQKEMQILPKSTIKRWHISKKL